MVADDVGPLPELIRALAVFAEPPTEAHDTVAEALELGPAPDGKAYAGLFSFQVYPYASVHLGPEGMMGGVAADRVAGFWRAVGQTPPSEPDHLSALLGLYASLLEAEAGATGPEAALLAQGRGALLHEHLTCWVFPFLDRVTALGERFYGGWAALLEQVLRDELSRAAEPEGLPLHLREAPPLPDPRSEGVPDFLSGLLAPVRTGMVVARADLTRMGRAMEVGIRIGERRYILEHLLAQAPTKTLEALAAEAEAWRRRHAERATWLGETGVFWTDRAERTAHLLRELAAESVTFGEAGDVEAGVVAAEDGA